MANEELKSHIGELQQQMESSAINNEDKNFIGHLMSEIVRTASEKEEPSEHHGLIDTLEQQAAKFDNSHPLLASTLRQIANTLSNIGI